MSPPRFQPSYFDMLGGRPEGLPPAEGAAAVIDDLVSGINLERGWRISSHHDLELRLSAEQTGRGQAVIRIGAGALRATLMLTIDDSGWVVAEAGGQRAYLCQPYEDYEIWPDNAATADPSEEAPGRIGKRRRWINLQAASFPQLGALANEHGWIVAEAID
jgi:hypothetical protein